MKIGKISAISCIFILVFSFLLTVGFCQDKGHLEAGKKLYNEGRFEEALKEFVAALQKDPTNEEITQYIDKTQMKIKELMEISRALVRDDKIAVRGKDIKDIEIKPSYYDQELNKLAEEMTRLIEKTKGKAGETRKEEILEGKEAEERLTKVKEYFEKGQKLYDDGKNKEAVAMWEKALEIAKGDPSAAQFIDELKARIEAEKKAQAETERKTALLAAEQEKEAIARKEEEKRAEKERQTREKRERERRLEEERARRKREVEETKAGKKIDKEAKLLEQQEMERELQRQKIKMYAWTGGIIFVSIFGIALLILLLRKPTKEIKPPEVKKKEKMFEQARPAKGVFQARKLRDIMKKKPKKGEDSSDNKRKNLFDKGE